MAAHDPQNLQSDLSDLVDHDKAKHRVPVHQFNPDSTPQQKGAAAGAAKDQLKPARGHEPSGKGAHNDPPVRSTHQALTRPQRSP